MSARTIAFLARNDAYSARACCSWATAKKLSVAEKAYGIHRKASRAPRSAPMISVYHTTAGTFCSSRLRSLVDLAIKKRRQIRFSRLPLSTAILLRHVGEERHKAGALDSLVDLALVAGRHLGAALAHDACVRGQELLEVRNVLVVNKKWYGILHNFLLKRNIVRTNLLLWVLYLLCLRTPALG